MKTTAQHKFKKKQKRQYLNQSNIVVTQMHTLCCSLELQFYSADNNGLKH